LVGADATSPTVCPASTDLAPRAAALLAKFEHLENIPDDRAPGKGGARGRAAGRTLAGARKEALLYRTLTTLVTEVPLTETLAELAVPK